jgi:hypothetical protein
MAVYSISGQQATLTSSAKSWATLACAGTNMRRFKVFDINVSQGAAPASTDTNIEFDLVRWTGSAATGTAYVCPANDPADAASVTTGLVNITVEPTSKAAVFPFQIFLNQRAPYRWQTYLGSGAEIVMPATASIGCAFETFSAGYTGQAGGTAYYQEQ